MKRAISHPFIRIVLCALILLEPLTNLHASQVGPQSINFQAFHSEVLTARATARGYSIKGNSAIVRDRMFGSSTYQFLNARRQNDSQPVFYRMLKSYFSQGMAISMLGTIITWRTVQQHGLVWASVITVVRLSPALLLSGVIMKFSSLAGDTNDSSNVYLKNWQLLAFQLLVAISLMLLPNTMIMHTPVLISISLLTGILHTYYSQFQTVGIQHLQTHQIVQSENVANKALVLSFSTRAAGPFVASILLGLGISVRGGLLAFMGLLCISMFQVWMLSINTPLNFPSFNVKKWFRSLSFSMNEDPSSKPFLNIFSLTNFILGSYFVVSQSLSLGFGKLAGASYGLMEFLVNAGVLMGGLLYLRQKSPKVSLQQLSRSPIFLAVPILMISYASNRFQLASGLILFGMILVSVALQVVTVFSQSDKRLFYQAITAYGKRMSLAIVSGNLIATFMAKALQFTPSSILAIGAVLSVIVGVRYWFHPNRKATQLTAA